MPSAANEIHIARPPAEVFQFLADPENDTRWRSGVLEMKHLSGSGVGARYSQQVAGPGGRPVRADIEITEFNDGRAIAFQTVTGPVRPRGRYTLSSANGGTQLRFELDAPVSGIKRLIAPLVQKTMNAEVGRLAKLKEILEEGDQSPSS